MERNHDREIRHRFWRLLGASGPEAEELVDYAGDRFDFSRLPSHYPLPDEPFVAAWETYQEQACRLGTWACLRQVLVQLRFPIRSGISETEPYRAATRRGQLPDPDQVGPGLQLTDPEGLRLFLHPTPAGRVPVLAVANRDDFVALLRALTRKNEPAAIPAAMGACIVGGYANWGRIAELRSQWEASPPARRSATWQLRFSEIAREPALYQDRFILLSAGPYSATAAGALGLSEQDWARRSFTIRLEHECAHYFTRHVLGSMRNVLFDELLADYMGLVASEGRYRPDWFLRFVGLEHPSRYRPGARMENYRGSPPLGEGAFAILQTAARRAAHNLELCDERRRRCHPSPAATLIALARLGLEGLCQQSAPERFEAALRYRDGEAASVAR